MGLSVSRSHSQYSSTERPSGSWTLQIAAEMSKWRSITYLVVPGCIAMGIYTFGNANHGHGSEQPVSLLPLSPAYTPERLHGRADGGWERQETLYPKLGFHDQGADAPRPLLRCCRSTTTFTSAGRSFRGVRLQRAPELSFPTLSDDAFAEWNSLCVISRPGWLLRDPEEGPPLNRLSAAAYSRLSHFAVGSTASRPRRSCARILWDHARRMCGAAVWSGRQSLRHRASVWLLLAERARGRVGRRVVVVVRPSAGCCCHWLPTGCCRRLTCFACCAVRCRCRRRAAPPPQSSGDTFIATCLPEPLSGQRGGAACANRPASIRCDNTAPPALHRDALAFASSLQRHQRAAASHPTQRRLGQPHRHMQWPDGAAEKHPRQPAAAAKYRHGRSHAPCLITCRRIPCQVIPEPRQFRQRWTLRPLHVGHCVSLRPSGFFSEGFQSIAERPVHKVGRTRTGAQSWGGAVKSGSGCGQHVPSSPHRCRLRSG